MATTIANRRETKECPTCRRLFTRAEKGYGPSKWGRTKYCSVGCQAESLRGKPRPEETKRKMVEARKNRQSPPSRLFNSDWKKTLEDIYIQKFWSRVKKTDGCWIWTGASNTKDGEKTYGYLTIGNRKFFAHRVSWELANEAPLSPTDHVLHQCDNPKCVRPDHLAIGDHAQNMKEKAIRGRSGAILTDDQIREIRESTEYQYVIAERFGVTQAYVSNVKNGKRRVWVDG